MPKFKFYALWLSLICILVFIIQNLFSGFTDAFLLNPLSFSEPWRFLTSIFLHGSLIHLMYNLFALALFGSILEKVIGGKKFLLVFFLSGIIANLVSVNFYTGSLGASGAIYGILGCLAVIKPLMFVWAFGFPMPMFIAAILWAGGSIFGAIYASQIQDNVGYIAHLSGIFIGILLGFIFRAARKRKKHPKYNRKIKLHEPSMRGWEQRYMLGR